MAGLKILYDQMDAYMDQQIKNAGMPLSCRKGCSACCRGMQLTVHLLEAVDLVHAYATRHGMDGLAALVPILMSEVRELAHPDMDTVAWKKGNYPCVLLEDSLCSVYEKRPSRCRSWVSFDDPVKCEAPGPILTLDKSWVAEATHEPYSEVALENGFPDSVGPIQYQMLLAILMGGMGPVQYARRVRGTILSDSMLSGIPWVHLEREEDGRWRELLMAAKIEAKRRGFKLIDPLDVMLWPEMAAALGGIRGGTIG